jgi:GNAT superfamily N-acetyltransferase
MEGRMAIEVRAPQAGDRAAWDRLYAGYADHYRVDQTPAMRDVVWGWLMDPAHGTKGFVAVSVGVPVGLAHYRPFARPLSATTGGFLDDLFVSPEARGTGAAEALIAAVAGEGRARGWSVIRWITAGDNARARKVYDRVAQATPWVTYDIKL